MANPASTDTAFFGHPRGLSTLFFTEMWERFSYYGMRALLLLYMTAPLAAGGLGFDAAQGGAIYGLYTSMAYMAALPGGWIADRLIGQRRAVLYGGIIIASGHFSMAIPSMATFYLGLVLIVIGTGLLKGNVSVIVGQLYAPAGHAPRRRLLDLLHGHQPRRLPGAARVRLSRPAGELARRLRRRRRRHDHRRRSSTCWARAHLGDDGLHPVPAASPQSRAASWRPRRGCGAGSFLALLAVVGIGGYTGALPITAVGVADAAGVGLLLSHRGLLRLAVHERRMDAGGTQPSRVDRGAVPRVGALLVGVRAGGSTLNLFADRDTRTEVFGLSFPSSWFQSVNSFFIFTLAPVFAWIWVRLAARGQEPSSPAKFVIGLVSSGSAS